MSRLNDYRSNMSETNISDREIETLLAGLTPSDPRLADLKGFVDALRSYEEVDIATEPPVLNVPGPVATGLAEPSNADKTNRRPKPLRHRLVIGAATGVLLLMGLSGVAIAADNAAPGSPLYGLDILMEKIGIGGGASDERIAEADYLFSHDQDEAAFALLGETLDAAALNGDLGAVERVQKHLELAASKSNPGAAAAQEKVAELQVFIEANRGPEGLNGREFGQGIADIARNKTTGPDDPSTGQSNSGPPDNAGPKPGKGNPPSHAGPKDKTP